MLDGICADAVEILKDTPCSAATFDVLQTVVPMRQLEAAELMTGQNNYTATFAKATFGGDPRCQRVDPRKKKTRRRAWRIRGADRTAGAGTREPADPGEIRGGDLWSRQPAPHCHQRLRP